MTDLLMTFEKVSNTNETTVLFDNVNPSADTTTLIKLDQIPATMRILVLGSVFEANNTATGISTRLSSLGYREYYDYTVTYKILTYNTYTGAGDLDGTAYNCIIIITSGSYQATSSFGTRLNTWVSRGNHLFLMGMTFHINVTVSPLLFDYSNYASFTYNPGTLGSRSGPLSADDATHPIVNGMSLDVGSNLTCATTISLTTSASLIASYPTGSLGAISVKTNGDSRLVGFNFYPANYTLTAQTQNVNQRNLAVNAILWCFSLI